MGRLRWLEARALTAVLAGAALVLALTALTGPEARADGQQLHIRFGLLNSNYSGPVQGSLMLPTSLDVEYERFMDIRQSYVIKTLMALDTSISTVRYFFIGGGFRFYPFTQGTTSNYEQDGMVYHALSRRRFYLGANLGISEVVVRMLSPVLQTISQMADIGGCAGYIFQLNPKIGLDFQGSASLGYGFSSVGVTGINLSGTAGISWSL